MEKKVGIVLTKLKTSSFNGNFILYYVSLKDNFQEL